MADILDHRLTRKTRRKHNLHVTATNAQLYDQIWRTFETIRTTLDPQPTPGGRRRRLQPDEYATIVAARTEERYESRKARLDWLANHLLEATYQLVPHEHRKWGGNLVVDATPVKAWGRYRFPGRSGGMSADPDAGLYVREPDQREEYSDVNNPILNKKKHRSAKYIWGWEAEFVVQTTNDPFKPVDFPQLILGMGFHKPSHAPAAHALQAFRSIAARGHKPGYIITDRLYFPSSNAEAFQLPIRQLGYIPIHDYRIDQLGIQDQYGGANLIDGNWYCPSMPEALVNATANYRAGRIDETTWRNYLERRNIYRVRNKERPDADGSAPMMCPAAGPGATCACPLKPQSLQKAASTKVGVMISIRKPPSNPDRICRNKSSVEFPVNAGAKYWQPLAHESREWRRWYSVCRNGNEGLNGDIKNPSKEQLAEPGRRRFRGYAAQYIVTAILAAAANIRRIVTFLSDLKITAASGPGGHAAPRGNASSTPDVIRKTRAKRRETTFADFSGLTPGAERSSGPPR
ncbi:hypothetical protein [Plantibacter sp. YIM 135249]|uniref:hypothetical protein n=1 Tax=Plantibacter sp. YIM 135249 TaxID=3423918 RepID=UPI003D33D295